MNRAKRDRLVTPRAPVCVSVSESAEMRSSTVILAMRHVFRECSSVAHLKREFGRPKLGVLHAVMRMLQITPAAKSSFRCLVPLYRRSVMVDGMREIVLRISRRNLDELDASCGDRETEIYCDRGYG